MSRILNYKEFIDKWRKTHQGSIFDQNRAWSDYKKKNNIKVAKKRKATKERKHNDAKSKSMESRDTSVDQRQDTQNVPQDAGTHDQIAGSGDIEVEAQTGDILQKSVETQTVVSDKNTETNPQDDTTQKLITPRDPASIETYKNVANSLHETLAVLIEKWTHGKIKIDQPKIQRLNESGAAILDHIDKTGKVAEYGPYAAYGLTIVGIGAEVITEIKQQRKEEEEKAAAAGTTPAQ